MSQIEPINEAINDYPKNEPKYGTKEHEEWGRLFYTWLDRHYQKQIEAINQWLSEMHAEKESTYVDKHGVQQTYRMEINIERPHLFVNIPKLHKLLESAHKSFMFWKSNPVVLGQCAGCVLSAQKFPEGSGKRKKCLTAKETRLTDSHEMYCEGCLLLFEEEVINA
jgi:hypothetical protein